MTTIARLVVEALVEPAGIRAGLDEGLGYVHRFNSAVQREFASLGDEKDGVEAARRIVSGLEREFERAQGEIREDLFRGLITPAQAQQQGAQVGQAYNAGMLAALDTFRNNAGGDRLAAINLPQIERTFVAGLSDAGRKGADALRAEFQREMQRGEAELAAMARRSAAEVSSALTSGIGTTAVGSLRRLGIATEAPVAGLSSLQKQAGRTGIAVAFAAEQWASGTESAARTGLRAIGTFALAFGPEGLIVTAIATGTLAVMDFFQRTEKQAQETLGKIAGFANDANVEALRKMQRSLSFGQPFDDKGKLRERSQFVEGAFAGSLADLEGKLRQLEQERDRTKATGTIGELMEAQRRVDDLKRQLEPMRTEFAKIREAILNAANQPADNAGRLPGMTVTAKAPGKEKPFEEMGKEIDRLTTTYNQLRDAGIAPTIALQEKLQADFRLTAALLAQIKDQASPAAIALRKMQEQISATHVNDSMITAPEIHFALPEGGSAKAAEEATKRVHALRDAFGELDADVQTAEGGLARMLAAVDVRIEAEGGALRASNDLLEARAALVRELEAAQKGAFSEMWGPEEAQNLHDAISAGLKQIQGDGAKVNEMWESMRLGIQGVIDMADGLGKIGQDLRQIASGSLHLIGAVKQVQDVRRERAAAQAREAKEPGTGGAMAGVLGAVSQVAAVAGVIGAGINLISGVVGLFSHHNQALEDNTRQLKELRESLVDTMGVKGQQAELDAIQNLRDLYSSPAFRLAGSGQRNQMIERAVNEAGLSIDQFNKIMSDFGIVPEKSGQWLNQLSEAIGLATDAATRFTSTLDDQRALIDLHNKVFQTTEPADVLASTLQLFQQFAPMLEQAFEGIDTTTEEGREQFRAALQGLVTMIENGTITPEQLGTLTGVKDLAGIIGSLSDSLDAMKKSTDAVTGSLTNVPAWYKTAAVRFAAVDPMPAPVRPTAPYAPTPPQMPVAGYPQVDRAPGEGVAIYGDVMVDARALSADELFDAILRVGQRRAGQQFNDPTRWSQVQR